MLLALQSDIRDGRKFQKSELKFCRRILKILFSTFCALWRINLLNRFSFKKASKSLSAETRACSLKYETSAHKFYEIPHQCDSKNLKQIFQFVNLKPEKNFDCSITKNETQKNKLKQRDELATMYLAT